MPHECTDCGRTFDDGSTEMLSGCPDCGGNKFQYKPDGTETPAQDEEPPEPPEPPVDSSVARTVGNAATAVRDLVGTGPASSDSSSMEPSASESSATETATPATSDATATQSEGPSLEASQEDAAQASARSEVVAPEDLPPAPETPAATPDRPTPVIDEETESGGDGGDIETDADRDRPDLETLREELNDQFESIRIVEPGQYELNLMELYDREEYIIALQEDGKYTIQVPERWKEE